MRPSANTLRPPSQQLRRGKRVLVFDGVNGNPEIFPYSGTQFTARALSRLLKLSMQGMGWGASKIPAATREEAIFNNALFTHWKT
jgi:hypothetical protein